MNNDQISFYKENLEEEPRGKKSNPPSNTNSISKRSKSTNKKKKRLSKQSQNKPQRPSEKSLHTTPSRRIVQKPNQ